MRRRQLALTAAIIVGCAGAEARPGVKARGVDVDLGASPSGPASILDAPPVASAEPRLPVSAIFVANPEEAFPRRAIVARYGKARFSREAEPVIDPKSPIEDDEVEVVVLEWGPDRIRVLFSWNELWLALYLEADDLREAPLRGVALDIAPSGTPVDARLVLFPGAEVDFTGKRAGERKARLHPEGIDASGWIKEADLGRVFVPLEEDPPLETHSIKAATRIHTSATGPAFGSIDPEAWPRGVRVLGDARNGRRKIAMNGPRFLIEGWIAETVLREGAPLTGGSGGRGYGWGSSDSVWLLPGAPLFASADGDQVGIVRKHTVMADRHEHRDARGRVGAHIPPWGWVDLWADEASLAEGKRVQQDLQRRRERYKVKRVTVSAGFSDPRRQLEAQHEDVLGCVDAAEKQGVELSGEIRMVVTAGADGRQEKLTFSGPLSKNDTLVACLRKELGFGLGANNHSLPGTLDATIEIGKKPK